MRIVIPFIAGILLQFYVSFSFQTIIYTAILWCLLFAAFSFLPESLRFKYRYLQGLLISLFLVATGMFLTWNKDVRHHHNWYGHYNNDSSFLILTLEEPPVEKAKTYKSIATVISVVNNGVATSTSGKTIVYFAKDYLAKSLHYGDRIIVRNKFQRIKNSGNPAAFNYAQYLAFQQIYFQGFLKKEDWLLLKGNDAQVIQSALFSTRNYVLNAIDNYIMGENESALAKALLIGYRIDLDKDLVQAYSNAGVVHLIAVSGLHLALIYGLLLWIAVRTPFLKKNKIARLATILFCLWFFAFLTGAPASVLRAAVMFSFISLGMVFNKNASIYNSLCISAFVLLCFDPFLFWNVGFQLSYLAVLGIVILHKHIYRWLYFKNKILDYTWNMAAVSIAAQALTIPLCFYYFHQLPLLFLIANLIAIPLATVALWGCIALVLVSPITYVAIYMGKLVTAFLWLMNHSVLLINEFPFALWENVSISVATTILLYLIFISLMYWLILKNIKSLKLALILSLIFTGWATFIKWEAYHQKRMVVYNVPGHQAIDFISSSAYYFLGDENISEEAQIFNFHIKPARISFFASQQNIRPLAGHYPIYQFYHKRIILVDSTIKYRPLDQKIEADYVIISKNHKVKIAEICKTFNPKMIIFDGSSSVWRIRQWKKECEELHLQSHSVSEQGAFVTQF